ncbi:putative 2-dehydropantoate 2-reductase [Planktothrix sp. FACHB-1365]|uniref:putative 2-dehydropantoate 2-reductase n=1 Tax=Planktothrix sp. FACHB-1365 TaxID=2692855 RepID=UPI001683C010|nr:putative 2-dehydropantoate 2-reductase [Planktothrix sp. FACHB-1365]MBD2485742.1 putative 2-dehydropantoate 2-reductase [Planktothrix sp. FACHB-1365]
MVTRSYAIIGTGAVGGFYGAKLQKAGLEVHFLLNRDYEFVRTQGLKIDSLEGNFTLPQVQAYNDVHQMPPCDVVIITLKTTHNYLLPQLLPPIVKPDGVVLLLQNGLNVEPQIAEIVGEKRVMGGLCFICSNKVGPGHIQHIDYSAVHLGEYQDQYQPGGISERMQEIAVDFQRAQIPIELSEDLMLSRWKKLVWNIPYNGLSVVLDARTDEIMTNPETRLLAAELMGEVVAIASSYNRHLPKNYIELMLDHTDKMKPYLTSMKLDYDAHRPLELEAIVGNPLQAAIAQGVDVPKITMLYQQLKFLDTRNQTILR